jgi:hypothetical protein
MRKPSLQQLLNETQSETTTLKLPHSAEIAPADEQLRKTEPPKRVVHKPGEVNISAYFPAEVKSALRLVQAKTGNNVKQCLAEALADYFRKHNVPVTVPLDREEFGLPVGQAGDSC